MKKSLSIALSLVIGLGFTIYVSGAGHIRFKLDARDDCDFAHSNHYYQISHGDLSYDQDYALLLAAAHSGKEISVRIDDLACSENLPNSEVLYLLQNF